MPSGHGRHGRTMCRRNGRGLADRDHDRTRKIVGHMVGRAWKTAPRSPPPLCGRCSRPCRRRPRRVRPLGAHHAAGISAAASPAAASPATGAPTRADARFSLPPPPPVFTQPAAWWYARPSPPPQRRGGSSRPCPLGERGSPLAGSDVRPHRHANDRAAVGHGRCRPVAGRGGRRKRGCRRNGVYAVFRRRCRVVQRRGGLRLPAGAAANAPRWRSQVYPVGPPPFAQGSGRTCLPVGASGGDRL